MNKHTPGKWTAFIPSERTNPTHEQRTLVLHPDGERIVCRLGEGITGARGTIDDEEVKANCRLLAAAPALLEALRELTTLLDFHDEQTDTEKSWIKTARSAIAAATGEVV